MHSKILLAFLMPACLMAQNNFTRTKKEIIPGYTQVLATTPFRITNPENQVAGLTSFFDNAPLAGLWDEKNGKLALPVRFNQKMEDAGIKGQVILWDSSGYYGIYDLIKDKWIAPLDLKLMSIERYVDGLARISRFKSWSDFSLQSRKVGYVDSTGNIAIPMEYLSLEFPSEGLICFSKYGEQGFGFVNYKNQVVIPAGLTIPAQFKEGLAKSVHATGSNQEKLYGYIDRTGKFVIKTNFILADNFSKGFARVYNYYPQNSEPRTKTRMGLINRQGKLIIPADYTDIAPFGLDARIVRVVTPERKMGILDTNGKVVLPIVNQYLDQPVDGYIIASNPVGDTGLMDLKYNWVFKPTPGQNIRRQIGRRLLVQSKNTINLYTSSLKPIVQNLEANQFLQIENAFLFTGPSGAFVYDSSGKQLGHVAMPGLSVSSFWKGKDSITTNIQPGTFIYNLKTRSLTELKDENIASDITEGFILMKNTDNRTTQFRNLKGEPIGDRFVDARPFSEGISATIYNNQGKVIPLMVDTNFRKIELKDGINDPKKKTPSVFTGPMSQGLGKWANQALGVIGYADKNGVSQFSFNAKDGSKFVNNRTIIVDTAGKYFFVDRSGNKINNKTYDQLTDFSNGMATFKENGRYGYLDTTGKEVLPAKYREAGPFHQKTAMVLMEDKLWFLIDRKGYKVNNDPYHKASAGSEGTYVVSLNNEPKTWYGMIDESGKTIISKEYDEMNDLKHGIVAARKGKEWYLMSRTGGVYTKMIAELVQVINKDYFRFQLPGTHRQYGPIFGIADMKGNKILEPVFDDIGQAYGDYIIVIRKSSRKAILPLK